VLADELGVDPGRDLVEAHRQALAEPAAARRELPRAVPDFTGREREVAAIERLSRTSAMCVPVAVVDGEPGVGKSAFAVHVAHRIAERFPDGQLYLDLHGERVTSAELLERLLHKVGVPTGPGDRAAAWRAALAGRRVLLVLDGVSDQDQVEPLLPGTAGCMVLITTTARLRLDAVATTTLTALTTAETTALFRAGAPTAPAAIVHEVTRLTDGLPALVRAAIALHHGHPQWTVRRFASALATPLPRTA
jgi:hypothetical protein